MHEVYYSERLMNGQVKFPDHLSEAHLQKILWQSYAWLLVIRLAYFLMASLEGYSLDLSLYSNLALSFPGPWLIHLLIVDIGLIITVFLYANEKHLLPPLFWKMYLGIVLITDIVTHAYDPPEISVKYWPLIVIAYIYILAYVALYRYAFHFLNQKRAAA